MVELKTLTHPPTINVEIGTIRFLCRWGKNKYIPFYAYNIVDDNTILWGTFDPEEINMLWQKYAPASSREKLCVVK